MYIDNDLVGIDNNSIPSILLIHGVNGRKENNFEKAFELVTLGYAIFAIELRGHGSSTGHSSLLRHEPDDMIEVIDFIALQYQFANHTHMGVLGISFGGGIGAILQAKDPRIHASVLYHPFSSLDKVLERIPIQNLIGSTPAIIDITQIQDAYEVANETNTQNLLIIQGLADQIIYPEDNIEFYSMLNGSNRDDIALELRPNLNHGDNDFNPDSLKLALAWLEHYFHDPSINTTDLNNEITSIVLNGINLPHNDISLYMIISASILLFIGLSLLIVTFKIKPYWERMPIEKKLDPLESKKRYRKMILYRTAAYILPVMISGVICLLINNSFIYGYLILYPLISSFLLVFIPSEFHNNWKEEWLNWRKKQLKTLFFTIGIVLIPAIIFLIFYNLNALISLDLLIPFWHLSLPTYFLLGLSSTLMDFLYLREWKFKDTHLLLILRPITLLIFFIFVPLQPFPQFGGWPTFILFIALFGAVLLYLKHLVLIISKYYKNSFSIYLLIVLPILIYLTYLLFRII
jgi:esterase/lipase